MDKIRQSIPRDLEGLMRSPAQPPGLRAIVVPMDVITYRKN